MYLDRTVSFIALVTFQGPGVNVCVILLSIEAKGLSARLWEARTGRALLAGVTLIVRCAVVRTCGGADSAEATTVRVVGNDAAGDAVLGTGKCAGR